MRAAAISGAAALAVWLMAGAAAGQDCQPSVQRHAVSLGTDHPVQIMTGQRYAQDFGPGWVFALEPVDHGWSVRVYEDDSPDAVDLTALTPPYRLAPNPRDILGWHFRNADNTGPNRGEVNAPQERRTFFISPELAGTGGFKPSADPDSPSLPAPDPQTDGLGWLEIQDYGLADLEPGQKARMVYLAFEGCLVWPKTEEEIRHAADLASPRYTSEDVETFGSCGLDLSQWDLNAAILPRLLGGDFDGDGSLDEAAQIRRKSDGARAIALCRAGTWLDIIGGDAEPGAGLRNGYIAQMEAWRLLPPDHGSLGYVGEPAWPDAAGDVLALERIEKELWLLYWAGGGWRSQQVYRFVEP